MSLSYAIWANNEYTIAGLDIDLESITHDNLNEVIDVVTIGNDRQNSDRVFLNQAASD